ncbi:serine hydrolase [Brevibacterium sp.]|uniref:D-alanyl-D-alanine carboxypeptidase family protein n=1 Tax=Brevibacterium sp. TaxID=1701 RepID=UPI002810EEE9|nr:serine hydrolase [Brevibacterium sp.]
MRRSLPIAHWALGCALVVVLVLAQALLSPTGVPAAAATPKQEKIYQTPADLGDGAKPPEPVAVSWAVGDLDSGELHVSHDIEKRHAPASTIKLLTALALVEVLDDPKQKVRAEFEDMEIDGTKVGIMQQNDYTVDDLFHAMLMSSANDAANALGRAAGGQEQAVALMNRKAAELGMTNTHAANTSGLDDVNQYTTVGDMMKLARAVCENDYLMKVVGTEVYDFPGGTNPSTKEKFKGYQIQNHTKIVGRVDGGLGLKNGYTTTAKGAYIAVAERNGRRVVAALLGAENSSRQTAVDLLDWDFAQRDPQVIGTVPLEAEATKTTEAGGVAGSAGSAATDGSRASGTDAGLEPAGEPDADGSENSALSVGIGPEKYLPLGLLAAGLVLLGVSLLIWRRVRKNQHAR